MSLLLGSSVARLQPSLSRKPGHAFVCPCLFYSGRRLLPREVSCQSSKFDLAAPRGKKLICTLIKKPECSRGRMRGYWAGARAILGSFLDPCSLGNFYSPLSNLLPSATPKTVGLSLRERPNIL